MTAMELGASRWSSLDTPILLLAGDSCESYGRKSVDLLQATFPNAGGRDVV